MTLLLGLVSSPLKKAYGFVDSQMITTVTGVEVLVWNEVTYFEKLVLFNFISRELGRIIIYLLKL